MTTVKGSHRPLVPNRHTGNQPLIRYPNRSAPATAGLNRIAGASPRSTASAMRMRHIRTARVGGWLAATRHTQPMTNATERSNKILDHLREQGGRITTARRAVVEALIATDGHATAHDIATIVQAKAPDIHLSSVYRTLDSLQEAGTIDRVFLGQNSAVYHLTNNRHHHLVCETCGQVIHLPHDVFDTLAQDLDHQYGFTLLAHHIGLTGQCAQCRTGSNP
jgi:Fur family ferric uptake transcriptional regulator